MALAIASTGTGINNVDTTTPTIDFGGTAANGDLLIAWVVADSNPTSMSAPSGWSVTQAMFNDGGSNVFGAVFHKYADGSEGTGTTSTLGVSNQAESVCWRITGHDPLIAPEVVTGAGSSASAEVSPISPTGGSKAYLFLVGAGKDTGDNSFTGFPTGYTNTAAFAGGGAAPGGGVGLGYGSRAATTATEDPDAFTVAENEQWITVIIAVHPGAAAPVSALQSRKVYVLP